MKVYALIIIFSALCIGASCSSDTEKGNPDEMISGQDVETGLVDQDKKILPDKQIGTDNSTDSIGIDEDVIAADEKNESVLAEPENNSPDEDTVSHEEEEDTDIAEIPDIETLCPPNAEEECAYSGEPATKNVGVCKAPKKTCAADGASWGECSGEILPSIDICTDSVDNDCNGTVNDGLALGADGCVCNPGAQEACYEGPNGTQGVGECKAGLKTCNTQGTAWSSCSGQVLPVTEICSNGKNDDCTGVVDDGLDKDGDGWTTCQGDCCDEAGAVCGSPKLVNPGAMEVAGNNVDDNCNNQKDEADTACTIAQKWSGISAADLLTAMEICKASQNASWGIVGTPSLTRADGSAITGEDKVGLTTGIAISDLQSAIMNKFGTDNSNSAIKGTTLAALSSGRARDNNDDPQKTEKRSYYYSAPLDPMGAPPADFISAHGGQLPKTNASCPSGSGAGDSMMLTVQLKVPTNANSFSFNFRFFSQEYLGYTCQAFNDFFVTMLYSSWTPGQGQQPIPADKNISFDSNGNYISVNSNQFFTVCKAKTGYTCPDGTGALAGTGWEPERTDIPGSGAGATKWLSTSAPVVPGETITLKYVVWDTTDRLLDSLVLLDNFKWSVDASGGPVTFACWDLNKNGVCDVATEDKSGDNQCSERDC